MENWYEDFERENVVSKKAAQQREKTGTVKTQANAQHNENNLLSRTRWKLNGCYVFVDDSEAIKKVINKTTGHILHLFAEHQTVPL